MPLPVVPDHFLVQAMFQRVDGDPVGNAFCFRNDAPTTSAEAAASAMRDLLDSFYGDRVSSTAGVGIYMSDRLFGLRYAVYDLGQPDAGSFDLPSLTWPTTAATTKDVIPPDVALTISWQTGKRGASHRGRTYLGPLQRSTWGTDGKIAPAAITGIIPHAQKLIGNPATRTAHVVVLSRTKGTVEDITGGYIDAEFDTQRRRGFKGAARTSFAGP